MVGFGKGLDPRTGRPLHVCAVVDLDERSIGLVDLSFFGHGFAHHPSRGHRAVDARSQKLLERLVIPDPRLNAGHVALSARGDLVALSTPRDGLPLEATGGVSIRPAKGKFRSMDEPAAVTRGLPGEALSVALHDERRLAAVTHPDAGVVTISDTAGQKLKKTVTLPAPRGITSTLDGEHLVVSHSGGKLSVLPWDTLEPRAPLLLWQTPFGGSHLYTIRSI